MQMLRKGLFVVPVPNRNHLIFFRSRKLLYSSPPVRPRQDVKTGLALPCLSLSRSMLLASIIATGGYTGEVGHSPSHMK